MGFRREVRCGIDLVVAQQAVVNLTLQLGSLEPQVTVTDLSPTAGVITATSTFSRQIQFAMKLLF